MEIGFVEDFALAKDRSKTLQQLIPGTEDYYYYSCLLALHNDQLSQVDQLLEQWIDRHGHDLRVTEIKHRRALLGYASQPKKTLQYLRDQLGLYFDHQRDVPGQPTDFATVLAQELISRDRLKAGALQSYSDLSGFKDSALDWLAEEELNRSQRRHLLQRLSLPDHKNLVQLVHQDLQAPHSSGFGSLAIHNKLTQTQLEQLVKLDPELSKCEQFVYQYMIRLQPGPDIDLQYDLQQRQDYLERLWQYVAPLAPCFHSLKVHVLYHLLDFHRRQGNYDRQLFAGYVQIPRQVGYMEPKYLRKEENRDYPAQLHESFEQYTGLPPVGDDEPLLREYLGHFFQDAKDYKPFDSFIQDSYLKRLFATTKILANKGDMEQWYSLLNDPSYYQELKQRVEIEFASSNPNSFDRGDPVFLDVDIKNVETLVVKVFEINALNYYLTKRREVDTDIDLDGLVAAEEKTYTYDQAPSHRVRHRFDFPSLSAQGLFVVEFIGGGRSSRALIRKGSLRFVERIGAAGHVFSIFDEQQQPVQDATLWLAGREYRSGDDGTIRVPFSTAPQNQTILLRHKTLIQRESFYHQAEGYRLQAGIYLDREQLLKRRQAQILIRCALYLNRVTVPLSLLREVTLTITSTDRKGISSSKEVTDFALSEKRDAQQLIQVPENLAQVSVTLTAKVQNASQNRQDDLSATQSFLVNEIDAGEQLDSLQLSQTDRGFVLYLAGKNGEPRAHSPVDIRVEHRDFVEQVCATLQTDSRGRVELGALKNICSLHVDSTSGASGQWYLDGDRRHYGRTLHCLQGERLNVPYMGSAKKADAHCFALLEKCAEGYRQNLLEKIKVKSGYLVIGELTAGDFLLVLKESNTQIQLSVAPGQSHLGWVIGRRRFLQLQEQPVLPKKVPLQIVETKVGKKSLRIQLSQVSPDCRVHLLATRFLPAFSAFAELGRVKPAELRSVALQQLRSSYVSGRDVGDEYRYILERRFATKFPGNMLNRPGLLLMPWAVRSTDTGVDQAAVGGAFGAAGGLGEPSCAMEPPPQPEGGSGHSCFRNLDYLGQPSTLLLNLTPDAKGVIEVERELVQHASLVRIIAVDGSATVQRQVALPEVTLPHKDLRLTNGLDPEHHFTEKKQISALMTESDLVVEDITTSQVEVYDTLARVYALFSTLSADTHLASFAFILRWCGLEEKEKRSKYSEYCCHELNFFISRKDPQFFQQVVQPHLRYKRHKTFMDHYLLGDDLSSYLKPWAFAQLNIVERILLSRRIPGEEEVVARHVGDLLDLLPPDIETDNQLFLTASQSSALETDDKLDLSRARDRAEVSKKEKQGRRMAKKSLPMSTPAPTMARSMAGPADFEMAESLPMEECEDDWDDAMGDEIEASMDGFDDEAWDESSLEAEKDLQQREVQRQFYRKLDKTQEWAENNYYHLTMDQQGPELITVNAFWRDFACHSKQQPFLSAHLAKAHRNFSEMMLALSVLDLPFAAGEHRVQYTDIGMQLKAATPAVVFHAEIKPASSAAERVPILVSQNYFRADDRYYYENGEQYDKYVTDEFLLHTVYLCQVILTNPTSSTQKLDLLLQIPQGALPVQSGFMTQGVHVQLHPYDTHTQEYAFYFPVVGNFPHFPVHVAKNEELIAYEEPTSLRVVEALTQVDRQSWPYISQNGSGQEVLDYLDDNNIDRLDLDLIAWRVVDRSYYLQVVALLQRRHVYQHTIWSYSLKHNDEPRISEYLQHCDDLLQSSGMVLHSPLVTLDPVVRRQYDHREYTPLVNARAHRLGGSNKILNAEFASQYQRYMRLLGYFPKLQPEQMLEAVYYLLLQDRLQQALELFDCIDRQQLTCHLQYDYLAAYIDFYRGHQQSALAAAKPYLDYPVDRWRDLFATVAAQCAELEGADPQLVDEKDREQQQAGLAASDVSFDFAVENRQVTVQYQNLKSCVVNYYLMDIELLFSKQPFVQQDSANFSLIKPNHSQIMELPVEAGELVFDLPERYHSSNVIVELEAHGIRRSVAYYANTLMLQLVENYGQLRVAERSSGKPLPCTYVKVYARMAGGEVSFYKDGYTDLRGKFDYTSLNTNELDQVELFSLLVMHEQHGAVIREANPPKR